MCYTGKCPHEMGGSTDTIGACGYKGEFKDHPSQPLTIEELKQMKPCIFAEGTTHDGCTPVRWVAVRGVAPDWAVYFGERAMSGEDVRRYGNKVFEADTIKKLVPCTDEAFKAYRY